MRNILKLFSQGGRRALFGLTALTVLASQLVFAVPVSAADFTLSGRVTTGSGSQAVENAVVDVLQLGTSTVIASDATDAAGDYAITVAQGSYDLRVTPPANSGLEVSRINNRNITADQTINFLLLPVSPVQKVQFSGTMRFQSGNPVTDRHRIRLFMDDGTGDATPPMGEAFTDANGNFSMLVEPGLQSISIQAETATPGISASSGQARFMVNANTVQDLTVPDLVPITINLTDPDGNPTNGGGNATLSSGKQAEIFPGHTVGFSGGSGADMNQASSHTFTVLKDAPLAEFRLITSIPQFKNMILTNLPATSGGETRTFQFEASGKVHFTGTVKFADGTPVPFPSVRILKANTGQLLHPNVFANRDANGNFDAWVDPGQHYLQVSSGSSSDPRQFSIGTEEANNFTIDAQNLHKDFVIPNMVKMTMLVKDFNGNLIGSPNTRFSMAGKPVELFPGYHVLASAGGGSFFSIPTTGRDVYVFPGTQIQEVLVVSPDSQLGNLLVNNLPALAGDETRTFVLGPSGKVLFTGSVKFQDGTPIQGIEVMSSMDDGTGDATPPFERATTDTNGNFSMYVTPGEQDITAHSVSAQWPVSFSTGTNIPVTQTTHKDFTLPNLVNLSVHLIDPDGNPFTGATGNLSQNTQHEISPGVSGTVAVGHQFNMNQQSSRDFQVFPNAPITRLFVNPQSPLYRIVELNNITGTPGNGELVVQFQHANPPGAPTGLTATTPTNTPVGLSWGAPVTAQSYKVFRNGAEVGTPSTSSFTDTPPASGGYDYTVAACNGAGCGPQSAAFTVVYDVTGPVLGTPSWFNNPATEGETATVTVSATDALSAVDGGEYFVGQTDPGQGNATAMNFNGADLSAILGDNLEPGTHVLNIRARDILGNWSTTIQASLVVTPIDETPPVLSYAFSSVANAAGWHNAPVTVTWTVSDPESAITNQEGCAETTFNTDGTHSSLCLATSTGGTSSSSVIVNYDATAPAIGTPTWTENPATEGQPTTLTAPVSDNLSGVAEGEYFIGTDPGVGNGTDMTLGGGNLSAQFDMPVGTYAVNVRVKDNAGNWSTVTTTQLVVDPDDDTPPVITYVLNPVSNGEGWNSSETTLTWTVADGESTISNQTGCEAVTVNTDGTQTFTCVATSFGGTASQSVTVNFDTTAPTLGTESWTANPVAAGSDTTLTIPVSDNLSGVAEGEYFIGTDPGVGNGASMNLSGGNLSAVFNLPIGTHTIQIRARDTAGNWSQIKTVTLAVQDSSAPVITYVMNPAPGFGGWHNAPVTVTWSVVDPESAVTEQVGCDSVSVNSDTAGTTYTCMATSAGGTASQSVTIKYDATAPVLSNLDANFLMRRSSTESRTFTVDVTDALSGVESGEFYIDVDPGPGNGTPMVLNGSTLTGVVDNSLGFGLYTLHVRAKDVAGNWSSSETQMFIFISFL